MHKLMPWSIQMYGDYTILLWCRDTFYKKLVKFFLSLYKARKTWCESKESIRKVLWSGPQCVIIGAPLINRTALFARPQLLQNFTARVGTQSFTISQIAMKMGIVDREKDPLTYIAP